MKIGMWLQNRETYTDERFEEVMEQVKNSDIDLFVFPEIACLPFNDDIYNGLILTSDIETHPWFVEARRWAEKVGKPVIFSDNQWTVINKGNKEKKENFIFNYYVHPNPKEGETLDCVYIKNTMTGYSPLEEDDKENVFAEFPIYKTQRSKNRYDDLL